MWQIIMFWTFLYWHDTLKVVVSKILKTKRCKVWKQCDTCMFEWWRKSPYIPYSKQQDSVKSIRCWGDIHTATGQASSPYCVNTSHIYYIFPFDPRTFQTFCQFVNGNYHILLLKHSGLSHFSICPHTFGFSESVAKQIIVIHMQRQKIV